jgi:putative tricarboxylic transport membrane protein
MEYIQQTLALWGAGLHVFGKFDTHILIFAGSVIGLLFGTLPGLSSSMALAIFIPFTFGFDPYQGIAFLITIYVTSVFAGALAAILVNIPGTPSSISTGFDGYPMAQRGEAGRAVGIATVASALGGLIGLVFLMVFSPAIVLLARRFGSWEYVLLAVMGITMISYISKGSIIKGLLGGTFGLFIATIGEDPIISFPRFTLNSVEFLGGINFVVILIGLFGMSEVFLQLESDNKLPPVQHVAGFKKSFRDVFSHLGCLIRSSFIGTFIGAIPAAGPSIASVVSYSVAKRASKTPEEFGNGSVEGILAAESSNNASVGGALIPMMTLGIPGDPMTAVLIGALMVHGLAPGPRLFTDNPAYVSSVYISYGIALIWVLINGLIGARWYAKLLSIPRYMLLPMIMLLCMVGSFSLANNLFDVVMVVVFGALGYFLQKADISPAPIILGVVLGPMFETNLRRAMILSQGNILPFVTRPVALVITAIIIYIVATAVFQWWKQRGQSAR